MQCTTPLKTHFLPQFKGLIHSEMKILFGAGTFSMEHKISIVAVESHLNMHICHVMISYEKPMGFCIRLICVKCQTWCHRDQQILVKYDI